MGALDWLADKIDPSEGKPPDPSSKPKDPHTGTFTDMIRGFQHCVERAQEVSERHTIEIIERYFTEEKDEQTGKTKLRPKMISFEIMKDYWLHYPLITLVEPNPLRIDEMEIEMAMRVNKHTIKKTAKDANASKDNLTRASFEVSFTSMSQTNGNGKQNAILVKMKFKAPKDKPEGITRIIDAYRQTTNPVPKGDKPPQGTSLAHDAPDSEGPGGTGETEAKKGEETATPPPQPPPDPPPAELPSG